MSSDFLRFLCVVDPFFRGFKLRFNRIKFKIQKPHEKRFSRGFVYLPSPFMKILSLSVLLLCCGRALAVPVSVSVVDSAQKPVEGALVRVESFGEEKGKSPIHIARSDAGGRAQFDLKPSRWNAHFYGRVIAFKVGLAVGGCDLTKEQIVVPLLVPTPRGGKIADANGQPIAGAKVELYIADDRQITSDGTPKRPSLDVVLLGDNLGELEAPFHTRTDALGTWSIAALPPHSRLGLNVSAPGFASTNLFIDPDELQKPLVLAPGASISGRVLGLDGAPAVGVEVRASQIGNLGGGFRGTVTTDAAGNYTMDGLAVGTYILRFGAGKAPFVVPAIASFNARAGQNMAPQAQAQSGVLVSGMVHETNGAPIQTDVRTDDDRSTSTDAKGAFQLRVLPGSNTFHLGLYEGKYLGERETKTLEVKAGDAPDLDWSLVAAPQLRGLFVDEAGAPVKTSLPLVPVELQNGQSALLQSDDTGHFHAPIPWSGAAKIGPTPYQSADYEPVGDGSVTLPFKGELRVVLRRVAFKLFETKAVDQDGHPLAGVKFEAVLWTGEGQNKSGTTLRATSDENGVIRFDKIAPNQSPENASASKSGYDLQNVVSIVRAGEGFTSTPLVLVARDGQVQGQVLNADGTPDARARLCAAGVETVSDEAGRFQIAGLSHGAQDVCALSADGQSIGFARSVTGEVALKLGAAHFQERNETEARRLLDELIADTRDTNYNGKGNLTLPQKSATDFAERVRTSAYPGYEFSRELAGVPTSALLDAYFALPKASDRLIAASAIMRRRSDWKTEARAEQFVSGLEADAGAEMAAPITNDNAQSRAGGVLAVAVTRETLGQTQAADAAFDVATKWMWKRFTATNPSPEEVMASNIGVFSFAPRLLERAMGLLDPESYAHHNAVFEIGLSLAQARGLQAARPFLDSMLSLPDSQPNGDGNRFSLKANYPKRLRAAIRAGGASNPALALQMAQAIPATEENLRYDYRAQAIAEAAFFQDLGLAKTLWREQVPTMQPNSAIRYAARIRPLDAALARELAGAAREKMDATDLDANKHIWYLEANAARFAFDEAGFSPARARYRLERAWPATLRDPESRYKLGDFVLAMGRIDVARAVEMARQIPSSGNFNGFDARLSLARALWSGQDPSASNE